MAWVKIVLDSAAADAERISDMLQELGAAAVTLSDAAQQPLFESALGERPLWLQTRVVGLFDAAADVNRIVQELHAGYGDGLPEPRTEPVEDRDWERAWMDHFHPLRFGPHLWICPSWLTPPDPTAINILLDPGLAFGTGTHPTTALCLERLDTLSLQNRTVVDYGCGSGVLAIAAALLGARPVWAVDIDPQALAATRNNARRNKVDHLVSATTPDALGPVHADVLVANILAAPLHHLALHFAELVRAGGLLVLSGILATQSEDVLETYRPWFAMDTPVVRDEWVRLEGVRHR